MRPRIIITLTVVLLSNLLVVAQNLPDTTQVSIQVMDTKEDPFDKRIILTDKATLKVIKKIHTTELDPWTMNRVPPDWKDQWGAKWFLSKEKEALLPKERLYDYQNKNYFQGIDSEYNRIQLCKIIQIKISPKGQYFMVKFVYEILGSEGLDLAGRTRLYLFDMTGKNVSQYKDDLSGTSDRSYFTDDDAFFTFAFIQPGPDNYMERPYKGMKILNIPKLLVVRTVLYDNQSAWLSGQPTVQGNYILIGMVNDVAKKRGFDIIEPHTMTMSRRIYDKSGYSYIGPAHDGIKMKTLDGTTRVDTFSTFEYVGF